MVIKGSNLSPHAFDALMEFLKLINEKIKLDEYWSKGDIIRHLEKKGFPIGPRTLKKFIIIAQEGKKFPNKKLFKLENPKSGYKIMVLQ